MQIAFPKPLHSRLMQHTQVQDTNKTRIYTDTLIHAKSNQKAGVAKGGLMLTWDISKRHRANTMPSSGDCEYVVIPPGERSLQFSPAHSCNNPMLSQASMGGSL